MRDMFFQNFESIGIKSRGMEEHMLVRKRTKTGVEMVKPLVDQFERENLLLDDLGETLFCSLSVGVRNIIRYSLNHLITRALPISKRKTGRATSVKARLEARS